MSDAPVATEALVLRRFDFGETSQIARLFTRDLGRLGVIAKGIKRPGPDLRGPMDLFALADIEIRLRRRSDLHLLVRYRVRTGFSGLRARLDRLWTAFYASEVLREGTRDLDPDPALFHLTRRMLATLEHATPAEVPVLTAWFELRFLDQAGFRPSLDHCVQCGRTAPTPRKVRFAPYRGGVVCQSCAAARPVELVTMSAPLRASLSRLLEADDPEALADVELGRAEHRLLRGLFPRLLEGVLEKELKSASFLR